MQYVELTEDNVVNNIKGNTLQVYWHLLKFSDGIVKVKETQGALGFSNFVNVLSHLEEITELDLIKKIRSKYCLVKVA